MAWQAKPRPKTDFYASVDVTFKGSKFYEVSRAEINFKGRIKNHSSWDHFKKMIYARFDDYRYHKNGPGVILASKG